MKLVIGGASGFVATELRKQALVSPKITSIVSLTRRELPKIDNMPSGRQQEKELVLQLPELRQYPEDAKKKMADADACVWCAAITPSQSRSKNIPVAECKVVCHDYPSYCLKTLAAQRKSKAPCRFVYISGAMVQRDQTKEYPQMTDYIRMRGAAESSLVEFAEQHPGAAQVCCVRPGLINGPGREEQVQTTLKTVPNVPVIQLHQFVAAMLDQITNGFEKDPLSNDDLLRIGEAAVKKENNW